MSPNPRIQTYTCPCCGGDIGEAAPIEQVVENVTQPSRRLILSMLADKPGASVFRDRIIDRLYGSRADGGPDAADNLIKSIVSQLRRQIEPFGWTISTSRGGSGDLAQWRLIPHGGAQ